MIRTSVTPQLAFLNIAIPSNYIGKKVEVLLYAVDEIFEEQPKTQTMADFWNTISNETAEKLHKNVNNMRDEWKKDI